MKDLASLGLKVRIGNPDNENEQRLELRLIGNNAFVAWFHTNTRVSADEQVVSTNTQIAYRSELSDEQVAAVRKWVQEHVLAAL